MSFDIKHGLEDIAKAISGDGISSHGSSLAGSIEKLAASNVEAARIEAEGRRIAAVILTGKADVVVMGTDR